MQSELRNDLGAQSWNLVLCKPNQHNIAKRHLSRLGFLVFLPQIMCQRHWRGRVRTELRPVFPGYLFVGLDPNRPLWPLMRCAQGESQIVGFGAAGPASVPAGIVAGLWARCDENGVLRHAPEDFAVGDKIRILSGPFAEFVTRIDRIDPERRLTVLLDLLGGPTKVVLPAEGVIRQD